MKNQLRIFASILVISTLFVASTGFTSDSPTSIITKNSDDLDLNLASELDDYRSRSPQGSLLESSGTASELFGSGGYLHPFVSLAEGYSDNIFNEATNTVEDFSTTLSTGLWLAYPPSREQLLNINTSNTTPGGLSTGTGQGVFFHRYQTYFLYQGDYVAYHDNSDANNNKQRVEALFQYNLKGGISFDFVEEYKKSQDPYSTGFSTNIDSFHTNLFDTTITYDYSELLTGKISFANYLVDYDDIINVGRNRVDNKFTASLEIAASPKTTFLTEYKYIDVDYDEQLVSDSTMNIFSGGVKWLITPKTSLKTTVDYVNKNFADNTMEDANDLSFQIEGSSQFNEKNSITLSANRQLTETNTPGVDYILSHNYSLAYLLEITQLFSANFSLSYANDQYNGLTTVGAITQERDDDIYSISPGLEYAPTEWLLFGLSYTYSERDSNFNANDYKNNSVMLRATLSI